MRGRHRAAVIDQSHRCGGVATRALECPHCRRPTWEFETVHHTVRRFVAPAVDLDQVPLGDQWVLRADGKVINSMDVPHFIGMYRRVLVVHLCMDP